MFGPKNLIRHMQFPIFLIDDEKSINDFHEQLIKQVYPTQDTIHFLSIENAFKYLYNNKTSHSSPKEISIFLDLAFPHSHGFDFIQEIEENNLDEYYNFNIYVITAKNSVYVLEKKKVYPMIKDIIEKPLTANKIRSLNLNKD